ncbi:MAG: S-methyl-5-thioribose-1-phosphate isomerase [Chloroflexi bacterium]|nr:S-methyl-5-thioribose-1-phosphate isomerase [Chloroflexota bacterium]
MVPLEWTGEALRILDQTKLPQEQAVVVARTYVDVANAIKGMQVRGAPAIGVAGAYAMALAAKAVATSDVRRLQGYLAEAGQQVTAARPTAVNLAWAVKRVLKAAANAASVGEVRQRLEGEATAIHREDIAANRRMGVLGSELLPKEGTVLTHCNAGALATGGYGTALGVIRAAWEKHRNLRVLATETRPLLQGARLTAWELTQMGIPTHLVVDSAAGSLMARGEVACVVVGADRIAANGDTANKIGTYTLAVVAHENNVPFYVVAPTSTLDLSAATGESIPIEERSPDEVLLWGARMIAPKGMAVRNPAFDVTPARYISAIITERGVVRPPYGEGLQKLVAE